MQIERRLRATGRDQTQARSCRPRPDVGGRSRHLASNGNWLRPWATLSNWTPSRRRLVAFDANDPATDQLPFDARALMSPAILRPISCRSMPEHSCRQRSCDRSVAIRRQSAHVASDPATDQLPFDARVLMSPAILRPISCHSTPERSCRQRSCDRSVAVRRQNAHVAGDPATDQLPFDAIVMMSPGILRPIGRRPSQLDTDNQTPTSCRPI